MTDVFSYFLTDYTFQTVTLGSALLGVISGTLGSFAVLRKQSLLGDGVSHAALPGIILAFLCTNTKNTELLLLGALLTGLLAVCLIGAIVRYSPIKFDSSLALVMSVFFGLGLVLLTYVQKLPNANQAGLKRFIYGQVSTLLLRDVQFMLMSAAILFLCLLLFWKEFKLLTFDSAFAASLGFPVAQLNLFLSFLTVWAIIIGLQTVGVVLMSAMLAAPAVAARQWSKSLFATTLLCAAFGGLSGAFGTVLSSAISGLPTGPAIVVFACGIAAVSLLFAPNRGLLWRFWNLRKQRRLLSKTGGPI